MLGRMLCGNSADPSVAYYGKIVVRQSRVSHDNFLIELYYFEDRLRERDGLLAFERGLRDRRASSRPRPRQARWPFALEREPRGGPFNARTKAARRTLPALRGRTSPSEVAPRPPRTHSIPRGRALPSESVSRSQGSHSVLRARIAFFEPESRFSDSDSAPQVRVPFLRFAFRSLDSNHTPWVCSRSPDSNLASGLHSALRTRIPLLQFALCSASRNATPSTHARPPSWNVAPLVRARPPNPNFAQSVRTLEAAPPHLALPAPPQVALPAPDVSRETFVRT